MKRKIYVTIGRVAKLNMPVTVGDRTIRITFSNGGLTSSGNGRFTTSDEKLQEALEKDPGFKKTFRLQDTIIDEDPVAPKAKTVRSAKAAKAVETAEPVENVQNVENIQTVEAEEQTSEVLSFANFNELRDYLIDNHGCSAASVRTLNQAIATAKKLGLEVEISK